MLAAIASLKSEIPNPRPEAPHLTPEARKPSRFVVTLDAPLAPTEALARIPLAITGEWMRGPSRLSITLQDLEAIVRNFAERLNGEINVDYDHASEMPEVAAGGPIPSAGRIVKLDSPEALGATGSGLDAGVGANAVRPNPNPQTRFILWGWYEPTERARELIQSREYRYISPAIDWAARDKHTGKPQGATLTSVALTNRPFLEELPQIRLSDPAYVAPPPPHLSLPEGEGPGVSATMAPQVTGGSMKHATLSVTDGKIKIAHEDFKDEYVLDPEEMKKCLTDLGLLSEAKAVPTAVGAVRESPPQVMAGGGEISLTQAAAFLSEAEARGKSISALAFFHAQVERELEDAVRAGKILPRQRENWRRVALSDISTFRKILAEQKPQVPLRPTGFSGVPPEDVQAHVKLLVEQRCREKQIPFGQALSEIGREHPELVHEYRRAVSGTNL